MKSMNHKTAKGVAAISLAMMMALPALTGCSSLIKSDQNAEPAQEATTQTQTQTTTADTKDTSSTDTKSKASSSTKKKAAVKQSGSVKSSKKSV